MKKCQSDQHLSFNYFIKPFSISNLLTITSKNETVRYSIGTDEMLRYFNRTAIST